MITMRHLVQLRIHIAALAAGRFCESCAWDQISLEECSTIPTDRADQSRTDRKLHPMEEGEPFGQYFNGAVGISCLFFVGDIAWKLQEARVVSQ